MRMITDKEKVAFSLKIETAINELSLENTVDMPDFIIADYMVKQFEAFNLLVVNYKVWHNSSLGEK